MPAEIGIVNVNGFHLARPLAGPPQAHVERTLSAVADMGILKSEDERPKLRQRQPIWHLPLEHAAFAGALACSTSAFTGDDQHDLGTVGLRALQEAEQAAVRLALRHSVQINSRVDRVTAAG